MMTNDKLKINRQASTHPDKGQCLPSFFPVARKEYFTRRHAAFGHYTIRILSPLDLTHLNPSPVP